MQLEKQTKEYGIIYMVQVSTYGTVLLWHIEMLKFQEILLIL